MNTIDYLRNLLSQDFEAMNAVILEAIESQTGLINDLSHHLIQSGGKRLRPMLVLLAAYACGYKGEQHIVQAAAIEIFHTATLLHDDVIDESNLRRGQKTANNIWGSKASVLAGDFLYTQFIQLTSKANSWKIVELMTEMSQQITCGELKQMSNRHNVNTSLEYYFEMIRAKTALLFAASAQTGAILADSSQEIAEAFFSYGLHLGNAYQLIDDALDYCADSSVLGKNIGDDLADGKATLPLIYALEKGSATQKQKIMDSLKEGSLEHLAEIQKTIEETKAIEYTKQIATKEIELALQALAVIPDSQYKTALQDVAAFVLERNF